MTDDRKPRHAAFDPRPDSDPAVGIIVGFCLCMTVYAVGITAYVVWRLM